MAVNQHAALVRMAVPGEHHVHAPGLQEGQGILAHVDQLALDYYESASVHELVDVKAAQFMRWFNLMGIQRHLKAIGIFSRLNIRDGKPGYLKDIPRTLEYLNQACAAETSMVGLRSIIEQLKLNQRAGALTPS